jgi:small subunit ribosomal protein S7
MTEILAFNRWSTEGLKVEDPGLERYITLTPKIVPKNCGKYAGNRFHKSRIFIVERLINRVMVSGHKSSKHKASSGHNTGKLNSAMQSVIKAFEIIEKKTGENPIKVFIKAIENGAPREEILTVQYGGARYPKPVECAPQRRVDIVLKLITQGAYQKCFNKKKKVEQALAEEILAAYELSANSSIVKKKLELERQADASR